MKMSSEKKKIFGVILSFLLVLSMSVPVMAEDENYPRYLDDAGLLSSSQAQKLEKKLDKISKEHHCDVVIAVANTTNGQDIESFTEDFYDSMGYGQGEKKSGIMLMVSMKERQWNMCTTEMRSMRLPMQDLIISVKHLSLILVMRSITKLLLHLPG